MWCMQRPGIQLLLQAWLAWETTQAWIPASITQQQQRPFLAAVASSSTRRTTNASSRRTSTTTTTTRLYSEPPPSTNQGAANNNDDDDEYFEDCEDEEECEIDWDAMPGAMSDSDNDISTAAAQEHETAGSVQQTESLRTRLEMAWQMEEAKDECDVEVPQSCGSEPCQACAGRGSKPCRFCRGTAVLYMRVAPTAAAAAAKDTATTDASSPVIPSFASAKDFCACPVCQQGMELCRACQGTGWVAEWTSLSSVHPF